MPPNQNAADRADSGRPPEAESAERPGLLDLVLLARRVVASGQSSNWVGVSGGRVRTVGRVGTTPPRARRMVQLAPDEVLLPGLVDSHVHVNEPGRTAWEGFGHAGRAALAGGVTTLVDMPLNSIPPTTSPAALEVKRRSARDNTAADVGFWGGAVSGNLDALGELVAAGVLGFKCFLTDPGVTEFGQLDDRELARALAACRELGVPLLVHAEDTDALNAAPPAHGREYQAFLDSRPARAEAIAVRRVVEVAAATGGWAHLVHISSGAAVEVLREARRDGVRVTAETCPHYLFFRAEQIPDGGTVFKCCPPIRGEEDQDALWQALAEGVIDCVVSDHSPCTDELKYARDGDFGRAWGGIAGLQLRLPVLWSTAAARGYDLAELVHWAAEAPAQLAGLDHRKGSIEPGMDADLIAFAPDARFTVQVEGLRHRNLLSPYIGEEMTGVVRRVWLRGEPVYSAADEVSPVCVHGEIGPHGKLLSGRGEGARRAAAVSAAER